MSSVIRARLGSRRLRVALDAERFRNGDDPVGPARAFGGQSASKSSSTDDAAIDEAAEAGAMLTKHRAIYRSAAWRFSRA